MPGPRADLQDIILNADATRIAEYLRQKFPNDRNLSKFHALAAVAVGDQTELPPDIVADSQDIHFFRLIERVAAEKTLRITLPHPKIIEIDHKLDFLEHTCSPERHSAIQVLCAVIQKRRPSKHRVAAVLMARDEGIYLPEWISHHVLIGIDHIFVYTNDNSDGSDELLNALAANGIITLIRNSFAPGVNPQRKVYQHAIGLLDELRDYKWAFFIDADEFVNFGAENTGALPRFIDQLEREFPEKLPGGVIFPWSWRYTDFAFSRDEIDVLKHYPHASVAKLAKSLVNLRETGAMCEVHIPTLDEDALFVDGEMRKILRSAIWNGVEKPYHGPVIEHFWSKSFVEFLIKKNRGDTLALKEGQFARELSQFFTWTGARSDTNYAPISDAWIQKVERKKEEFLHLPGVSEAYEKIVARYRQYACEASTNDETYQSYLTLREAHKKQ